MLKANHPLRRALWIWPGRWNEPRNVYAQFRFDFPWINPPKRAMFHITADQSYMLYVNGQYVTRGPARGYQKSWPFDTVDIGPYLRSGRNWMSVLVYNAGISTFQYLHKDAAGFICAGEWEGKEIHSGPEWQMRLAPAHKIDTARLSMQLNFQECFDARLDDSGWITSNKKPTGDGWEEGGHCWRGKSAGFPFGTMPWHDLEERAIPNLGNIPQPYQRVVSTATGKCATDWKEQTNQALPLFTEMPQDDWTLEAEPAKRNKSKKSSPADGVVMLPAAGRGNYTAACLDLGQLGVGTLTVEAQDAAGGETIDFFFTEAVREDGRPVLASEIKYGCEASFVARVLLRAGKTKFETFQMMGHRYVVAIARETNQPVKLKLTHRDTTYPLRITGKFKCNDRVLNDIYDISVRTQQVCMLDAYVDTPWREQAQWWGDARVQAMNTFYLSGDTRLFKRGIRSIADQHVPNGLTFGHAPTIAYSCILPDFSLTWILTIWDYYFQTGDISLFEEQWPRIQQVLEYFKTEGRGKTGLLEYDERYWLFLDWCTIQREGTPTLLNLWYLLTLEKLVTLVNLSGTPGEKKQIQQMYDDHRKLVDRKLWDSSAKMFHDGLKPDGSPAKKCSIHSQILAIMCGLREKHHEDMVQKRLLPYLRGRKIASALPSSYWVTYVYEVMTQQGYGAEVLAHIRENWQPMIPFGGCWEMFQDLADKGYDGVIGHTTTSHAWAAHPIYHLVRTLGGLTPTAVAWKHVHFEPVLAGAGTSRTRVVLPTPQGTIRANWIRTDKKKITVQLSLPYLVKADVVLPGLAPQTVAGEKTWEVEI